MGTSKANRTKMAATKTEMVKAAKVSPAFLHANSTSHTWPFSAIAEIIDNAYDPDVGATEIWIDHRIIDGEDTMCFVDNGNGMNQEKLYKMLSFGYCEKVQVGSVKPVGYYGNGFKSGSMRLGKDALVFTRCTTSTSVGLLSQTYLKAINAGSVLVPIVTWDLPSYTKKNTAEAAANLKAILSHSLFKTEADLFSTLKALENMRTGTTIILYNLKKDRHGTHELDFTSDPHDIRNPETSVIDLTNINRPVVINSREHRQSLREYCSILYLKPRMKIVLRGKKIKSKFISKSLIQTEKDVYKPGWLSYPVKLTFGFTNSEDTENYGLMMYHKNRLIRAYEKIGCQTKANDHGVGVVGVVEVNFLEPIHNKQDFNRTEKYTAFMQNAANKLNDYFYEKTNSENPDRQHLHNSSQLPDWTWAQCDNCLQWRRLPTGYNQSLPDKWYCRLNPDAAFNRCDIPEEPEDDDEALQASYRKTYKKTLEMKKRKIKQEEEHKRKEREIMLQKKELMLRKKEQEIKRQTEELAEVSSSQDKVDRKPTIADLDKAKQSLKVYHRKLVDQQETIKQLEHQKKQIEGQKKAMLRMADTLRLNTNNSQALADKVTDMAGTSSSTVTSSSQAFHAPKRKGDITAEMKAVKVKKEKLDSYGLIDLTDEEINDASKTTSTEPSIDPANVEAAQDSSTGSQDMEVDVKPDKSVLDPPCNSGDNTEAETASETSQSSDHMETDGNKRLHEKESNASNRKEGKASKEKEGNASNEKEGNASNRKERSASKGKESNASIRLESSAIRGTEGKDGNNSNGKQDIAGEGKEDNDKGKDSASKERIGQDKVLVQKSCQTVPTIVKFASPEEQDFLKKLSAVDTKNMLLEKSRELDEMKDKMGSLEGKLSGLQENIWQLLKIIVPDFDYGNPENIENVILDFLRVNNEEADSSQES